MPQCKCRASVYGQKSSRHQKTPTAKSWNATCLCVCRESTCNEGALRGSHTTQAFQAMQSKGCKPDSIVYNAIIDALWDTGIVWAQQHAALLYRRASSAGLLCTNRVQPSAVRSPACKYMGSRLPGPVSTLRTRYALWADEVSMMCCGESAADRGGFLSWECASYKGLTRCGCAGYLRRAAHASPGYLELCLHTLTMGVAVLSLFTWLADLQ